MLCIWSDASVEEFRLQEQLHVALPESAYEKNFLKGVKAILSSRAIMNQIVPVLVILQSFAECMGETPLYYRGFKDCVGGYDSATKIKEMYRKKITEGQTWVLQVKMLMLLQRLLGSEIYQ